MCDCTARETYVRSSALCSSEKPKRSEEVSSIDYIRQPRRFQVSINYCSRNCSSQSLLLKKPIVVRCRIPLLIEIWNKLAEQSIALCFL